MCVGAIVHSRIQRLVFGASEPKAGAVKTNGLIDMEYLNHRVVWDSGVLQEECGLLVQEFFGQAPQREKKSVMKANDIIVLTGPSAMSRFRLARLKKQIPAVEYCEYVHVVILNKALSKDDAEILESLLDYGPKTICLIKAANWRM